MRSRKVIACFFRGIRQISTHRNVSRGRHIANYKRLLLEMELRRRQSSVETRAEEGQNIKIRLLSECTKKAVRGRVTCQLVVVPEKPAQDLISFGLGPSVELAMPTGLLNQNGSGL